MWRMRMWAAAATLALTASVQAVGNGSSFEWPAPDTLDKLIESLPKSGRPVEQQIDALFLAALGRFPTATEAKRTKDVLGDKPTAEKWKLLLDALVKMPEFEAHTKTLQKRLPPATPAFPGFLSLPSGISPLGPFPAHAFPPGTTPIYVEGGPCTIIVGYYVPLSWERTESRGPGFTPSPLAFPLPPWIPPGGRPPATAPKKP